MCLIFGVCVCSVLACSLLLSETLNASDALGVRVTVVVTSVASLKSLQGLATKTPAVEAAIKLIEAKAAVIAPLSPAAATLVWCRQRRPLKVWPEGQLQFQLQCPMHS